jgi:2-iminobutanoate/2-iminopropanoate deaminase
MSTRAVHTDRAPEPVASYSQAVQAGNLLQVAGQGGVDPRTGEWAGDTVEAQTRQTLDNLVAILEAAGAGLRDVIMARVYLTERAHFAAMNEVYSSYVSEPFPARTTVFVGLAEGMLVEIDALAVIPSRDGGGGPP